MMNDPIHVPRRYSAFPLVVKVLLVLNVAVFIAQMAGFHFVLTQWLALWPADTVVVRMGRGGLEPPAFHLWQLVTYAFLHGGFAHLFFNLFALWMFGSQVENLWGWRRFALYYVVCVVGAGIIQLFVVSNTAGHLGPTLGASGGVFGVLLAFGMMFPNRTVMLLIPPIPMKAKWFVILYGALELVFGVTGAASNIAHFAHLGGMLFGFLLIVYWRSAAAARR